MNKKEQSFDLRNRICKKCKDYVTIISSCYYVGYMCKCTGWNTRYDDVDKLKKKTIAGPNKFENKFPASDKWYEKMAKKEEGHDFEAGYKPKIKLIPYKDLDKLPQFIKDYMKAHSEAISEGLDAVFSPHNKKYGLGFRIAPKTEDKPKTLFETLNKSLDEIIDAKVKELSKSNRPEDCPRCYREGFETAVKLVTERERGRAVTMIEEYAYRLKGGNISASWKSVRQFADRLRFGEDYEDIR